jgi:hypothetical protein
VLVANGAAVLGADPLAEAGAAALVEITSPLVYPDSGGLDTVIRWIDHAHERFVARWPEAAAIAEIREHAASLIARLATLCARRAPIRMSRWYMAAARYDLPTFARGSVRFLGSSARGLIRSFR